MIITFQRNGHHQSYDETLRNWVGQTETLIPYAGSIRESAVNLGRILRRPFFWKTMNRHLENDALFFSYWDDVIPFYMNASYRRLLCPRSIGAIWMNTWGFRTHNRIDVKSWNRYAFLKDESLTLGILDEGVYEKIRTLPSKVGPKAKLFWMPDFTNVSLPKNSETLFDSLLNFANGRKILLCIGVLNGFKNLELLKLVADRLSKSQWVIAIIGAVDDVSGVHKFEENASTNIFLYKGRLESEEVLNSLIKHSSLVWGAYKNWEGSSNIQVKAGYFRVPILTFSGFLMGERTKEYDLGLVGDENQLLAWANDSFKIITTLDMNSKGINDFVKKFSIENAKRVFLERTSFLRKSKGALNNFSITPYLTVHTLYFLSQIYSHLKKVFK